MYDENPSASGSISFLILFLQRPFLEFGSKVHCSFGANR